MTVNFTRAPITQYAAGKVDFLGLFFDDYDAHRAVAEIVLLAKQSRFSYVVTPNVDHIVSISQSDDPELSHSYQDADMILCDSRILASLARYSRLKLHAVPGSDLTRDLLQVINPGLRLAVIGGEAVLHAAMQKRYPQFDWVFHEPPMGMNHNPAARLKACEFVENASAAIIFFAIGAPQSEITCHEIVTRGRAKGVALCIGASLEFLTGAKKRAPNWMQGIALEWLFRLTTEPKRLWRRYLLKGPQIFLIWWCWRSVRGSRHRGEFDSTQSDGK